MALANITEVPHTAAKDAHCVIVAQITDNAILY